MNSLVALKALVQKDLRIDFRTRDIILSMLIFALLTLVIFNFAFDFNRIDRLLAAPGILWISILFASVLGLNKGFQSEKENDAIFGLVLAPVDPGVIYLAKFITNLIFLVIVEVFLVAAFIIFLNIPVTSNLFSLIGIIFLTDIGIIALGTLVSAMAVNTRARETMLPIILFPMLVPVILSSINLTGFIIADMGVEAGSNWLKMIIAFDIIFFFASWVSFEHIIKE